MLPESKIRPLRTASWLEGRGRSVLRQMVGLVSKPGIVSLAGGLPDPELFPAREYGRAIQSLLDETPAALQYSPIHEPLRAQIVDLVARRGISCVPEQVFLTTGAQQGIDIATRLAYVRPLDAASLDRQSRIVGTLVRLAIR